MSREVLQQAFDALNLINHRGNTDDELLIVGRAMTDIKERLANPDPEPVADMKRLSDDELDELHFQNPDDPIAFARAVETALMEKNK